MKILFGILFMIVMFMACETDVINDETGIEDQEIFGKDGDEEIQPG
ncbi:hypothetical protein [Aquimarina megaterium]|nr:hypothetical protein [Aquimarina megaterium]